MTSTLLARYRTSALPSRAWSNAMRYFFFAAFSRVAHSSASAVCFSEHPRSAVAASSISLHSPCPPVLFRENTGQHQCGRGVAVDEPFCSVGRRDHLFTPALALLHIILDTQQSLRQLLAFRLLPPLEHCLALRCVAWLVGGLCHTWRAGTSTSTATSTRTATST